MTAERRYVMRRKLERFFEGSGRTAIVVILTVILTAILGATGKTFISIPIPSDYITKTVYHNDISSKLDKTVYEADKISSNRRLDCLEKGQQDLINLHLYPEETRRRMLRERNGG
jgi:hypothetical protein